MQPTGHRRRSWQRPESVAGPMDHNLEYERVVNRDDDSVEAAAAEIEGSTNADLKNAFVVFYSSQKEKPKQKQMQRATRAQEKVGR
jgi:hypothetical protein